MESLIQQAIRMADTFAQVMCNRALNEFECLMYERICDLISAYSRCSQITYRINEMQMQIAEKKAQKDYQAWLENQIAGPENEPKLREEGSAG